MSLTLWFFFVVVVVVLLFFFVVVVFGLLSPHPQYMEVPRLGVESEL